MSSRPSPSKSATLFAVGTFRRGNDGNIWVIRANKNGIKRWVKAPISQHNSKRQVVKTSKIIIASKVITRFKFKYDYVKKYQFDTVTEYEDYLQAWEKRSQKYYLKMSQVHRLPDNILIVVSVTQQPHTPDIIPLGKVKPSFHKTWDGYAGLGSGSDPSILAKDLKNIGPWPYSVRFTPPKKLILPSKVSFNHDIPKSGALRNPGIRNHDKIKRLLKGKRMKKLSNREPVYKQLKKKIDKYTGTKRSKLANVKYITMVMPNKKTIMIVQFKVKNSWFIGYAFYGTLKHNSEAMNLLRKV